MNDDTDVFVIRDSISTEQLSYTEIQDMIPKGSIPSKKAGWRNDKLVEWRWRFYQFEDKKYAEISYIKYNEDYRSFLNKDKTWTKKKEEPYYPENLIEERYYYCK